MAPFIVCKMNMASLLFLIDVNDKKKATCLHKAFYNESLQQFYCEQQ